MLRSAFRTMKSLIITDPEYSFLSVAGKPLLEYQINFLKEQGATEVLILYNDMLERIESYFGSGLRWNIDITYIEDPLQNTVIALKKAEKYLRDTFVVLRGDSYVQFPLQDLLSFHKSKKCIATICTIKTDPLHEPGTVYVFEPEIFKFIDKHKPLSLEEDIFPVLTSQQGISVYESKGYVVDFRKTEALSQFKKEIIQNLTLTEHHTLADALAKMSKSEINLIIVADQDKKMKGVLTDRIIKRFLLEGGDLGENIMRAVVRNPIVARITDDKEKIEELLFRGINSLPILDDEERVFDVAFRLEKLEKKSFPIVRGKAPLRVSFAGGGTDLPYFFEKYGGAVLSATIDKYCYATVVKRADKKIIIDSDLTEGVDIEVESIDNLVYNGKFDLIKAIINIMRPHFGFELYLHNDIPPGRGLGSSASAAVLVASILNYFMDSNLSNYKIAEIAYKAERDELKIKGGWQDQYATVTGGFNFMEFGSDKTLIYPLRLKDEVVHELKSRLLLCYVGKSHSSTEVHQSQESNFKQNEEHVVANLTRIKQIALEIRDALLTNNLESFGKLLHESWEHKRKLATNMSDSRINILYETGLQHGAYGGKLLGAGNGGYLLFFYQPKRRNELKKTLEKAGGEVMDFNFDFQGTVFWPVKNKF